MKMKSLEEGWCSCHCRSLSRRRFTLFTTSQPDPSHPFSRTTSLPYRFTRTKPTSDTRAIPTISAPDSPDSLEPPRLVIRSRTTNHRPCLDSDFDVGRPPRSARSLVHPLPFEQMDVLVTNQTSPESPPMQPLRYSHPMLEFLIRSPSLGSDRCCSLGLGRWCV